MFSFTTYNIFTNLSPLWILLYRYFSNWEILRNYSTIFRSSHWRCSLKKAILKDFVIFTGKHLCRGLFFNKVADHQSVALLKRDSNRDIFLQISGNLQEDLFWRTLANGCIFGIVIFENIFQIRSELSKRNYWRLCGRLLKLVNIE